MNSERVPFSIGDLMWLVLCAALLIGFFRSGPEGWSPWFMVGLVGLLIAQHIWFFTIPQRFLLTTRSDNPARQRRWLTRISATPSLLGPIYKQAVWIALIQRDLLDGRPVEAERVARQALRRFLPRSARALFFERLADCLHAQGRHEEADRARVDARTCLKKSPRSLQALLVAALEHNRDQNYPAEYEAYRQAYKMTSRIQGRLRSQLHLLLALSALNCGRPDWALGWTEDDRTSKRSMIKGILIRIAAVALSELGRYDEAEQRANQALGLIEEVGPAGEKTDLLALQATLALAQGRLQNVRDLIEKAQAGNPDAETFALKTVRADLARQVGDFDEAFRLLVEAQDAPVTRNTTQALRDRVKALAELQSARVLEQAERPEAAWEQLQRARNGFGVDPRGALWCESLEVALLPQLGQGADALTGDRIARLETAASPGPDRVTRLVTLAYLGRWAECAGQPERSARYWQTYLDVPCAPIDRISGAYHLGRAWMSLGDRDRARNTFRLAIAQDVPTYFDRLARTELETLEQSE